MVMVKALKQRFVPLRPHTKPPRQMMRIGAIEVVRITTGAEHPASALACALPEQYRKQGEPREHQQQTNSGGNDDAIRKAAHFALPWINIRAGASALSAVSARTVADDDNR